MRKLATLLYQQCGRDDHQRDQYLNHRKTVLERYLFLEFFIMF